MAVRVAVLFVVLMMTGLVWGCAASTARPAVDAKLVAADIDGLCGGPWAGTLTYLDYTSQQLTVIDSSLLVHRVSESPRAWEVEIRYPKEPNADSKSVIALRENGRQLGDERVLSRIALDTGGVMVVTEERGEDDNRAATFRFEYTFTADVHSKRKLVRFDGEKEFFERHVYRWTRVKGQ